MADLKSMIHGLEDRRYAAMIAADAKALGELLADTLVYTHSYGGSDTKASYMEGVLSKKWIYRKVERPVENMQVHGDDCVIVTGRARIELLADGQPKTLNSAFTNVWVKGPKGWQMTAWQSTPLAA